jgi:signal recognition particle GTPase
MRNKPIWGTGEDLIDVGPFQPEDFVKIWIGLGYT